MPATETQTLAAVIRSTWKALALADQSDADELLPIIKATLESLEELEAAD
jgi:hypothetical protein